MILEIALPTPLRRNFDYSLPASLNAPTIGARVLVSFGRQKLVGIVVAIKTTSDYPFNKLKPVLDILDQDTIFPEPLFSLLRWSSDYYHHPLGEVLHHALPAALRVGKPAKLTEIKHWTLSESARNLNEQHFKRAPRQLALFKLLQQHPNGLSEHELKQYRIKRSVIKTFLDKEWVITESKKILFHESVREDFVISLRTAKPASTAILNAAQQAAVDAILRAQGKFQTFLLNGITGSGKTEVYLQVLEKILADEQQILVLVPEIALTPQTLQRFQERFSAPIAIYHSALNDNERLQTWLQVKEGQLKLVIATRSGIFLPFKQLSLIIIDEEHDLSFKQQEGFRYSARDLAVRRAQLENIPIVLGSATPSLESFYNAQTNRYQPLLLPERAGGATLPGLHVIDMRQQKLLAGITTQLLQAIKETLSEGNQVLLFLNRRGFAPTYLCHACGWIANCLRCDAYLTLHQYPYHLHCHHCDASRKVMTKCPQCHSHELLAAGVGTQQLEKALAQHFSSTAIVRIDRDTTRRKGSLDKHLKTIQQGQPQILIGTQMLAKGHHFPNVTLVGILNTDNGLFSSDFRAIEHTAQLILQVAGRAGRADKPGRVFIQTHHPNNPLLQKLIQQGYNDFAADLLPEREAAQLPPFSYLALLRAESVTQGAAHHFLQQAKTLAQQIPTTSSQQSTTLLGPISAMMEKRAGRYRAQLLFRSSQRTNLQKLLTQLCLQLEGSSTNKVRWSIDVDPQEIT